MCIACLFFVSVHAIADYLVFSLKMSPSATLTIRIEDYHLFVCRVSNSLNKHNNCHDRLCVLIWKRQTFRIKIKEHKEAVLLNIPQLETTEMGLLPLTKLSPVC